MNKEKQNPKKKKTPIPLKVHPPSVCVCFPRVDKPIRCAAWVPPGVGWKGDRWIPASAETCAGKRLKKTGPLGCRLAEILL